MIAITQPTRRTMYAKGGTETYTVSTYSSSDTSGTMFVRADNGWQEVTVDDLQTIEIKEPAQEQDEPDTVREATVYWEWPHRRLATVTARRGKRPPRKASTYG